jgi:hypothetical protein
MNFVREMQRHQARHFSQNGEDGVIERLFGIVGVSNRFYVEIGAGAGDECNTRWLRENGWSGVMLDRDYSNPDLSLFREFVTAENVNDLLAKYRVPVEFDLLSIDIDGNDYWVWRALLTAFRPRVVVVEFSVGLPLNEAITMPYDPLFRWAGESWIGQSLLAAKKLGEANGYSLIYASPPNAFLALRSLLPGAYVDVSVSQALGMRLHDFLLRWRGDRSYHELRNQPWIHV